MTDLTSQYKIRVQIGQVVDTEGWVHQALVLRRVCRAWGVRHAGSRIQEAFERALRSELASKRILRDRRGFLTVPGQTIEQVRVPNIKDGEVRGIDEVPRYELQLALIGLVRDARRIERDELTKRVSRLFGWLRRGDVIQSRLDRAVDRLVREGTLAKAGGALILANMS